MLLDNCAIHYAHDVKNLFNSFGVPVFFIPPYSPDYNPIEEFFSYVKYYLKAHDDIIQTIDDPTPIIHSAFQSVKKCNCEGWIDHSGYS